MAGSFCVSEAAGFDLTACGVSCLVRQHWFALEENSDFSAITLRRNLRWLVGPKGGPNFACLDQNHFGDSLTL